MSAILNAAKFLQSKALSNTSGAMYLLVPTLVSGLMSISSVSEEYFTASPKSAMQHVKFSLTRMFLLLMSRCAIGGFPLVPWISV